MLCSAFMSIPPDEHQRIWNEAWQTARQEKLARRERNREEWRRSKANVMSAGEEAIDAIAPEVAVDPSGNNGSRSLRKMREIMSNPNTALHRRIDAAEVVLAFELAPGAAIGADVDQIAAGSYKFLNAVIDTPGTPEALRFRALKLIASIENQRAATRNTAADFATKRYLLINLVNSERQRLFRTAGRWPAIVSSDAQWAISPSDDFEPPKGWFDSDWKWPVATFAAQLERSCDPAAVEANEAFRLSLRSVRATNRRDDWERHLKISD